MALSANQVANGASIVPRDAVSGKRDDEGGAGAFLPIGAPLASHRRHKSCRRRSYLVVVKGAQHDTLVCHSRFLRLGPGLARGHLNEQGEREKQHWRITQIVIPDT